MRAAKIVPVLGAVTVLALSASCSSSTAPNAAAPRPPVSSSLSVNTPPPAPTSSTPPSTAAAPTVSSSLSSSPRSSTSRTSSRPAPSSTHRTPPRSTVTIAPPPPPPPTSSPPPGPSPTYPAGSGPLVVLDPGHNGGNAAHVSEIDKPVPAGYGRTKPCNTTGTSTNAGYPEHAFNWDVALRAKAILQASGVRVVLTRPNDTGVGPCVDQRARIQSGSGVAAAIAIHADGAAAGDRGFVVFTAAQRPEGASVATVQRSKQLATAVHDSLVARSGVAPANYYGSNGYASSTEYAGLNLSTSPTAFLELGNMRDPNDAAYESSGAGRQRIAAAIAAGILAYLR